MRRSPFRTFVAAALACVGISMAPSVALADGDASAGATVFNRCSACHQVGEGARNAVGPHLNGIIGRPLASVQGYDYSDALAQRRGEFWNPDLVVSYISDPARFIGSRSAMPAQRLRPGQIADLIAFLEAQ